MLPPASTASSAPQPTSISTATSTQPPTYLHHPQLPQPLLNKLLYPPFLYLGPIFPKSIYRPSLRILAEIVGGELPRLSEEGAELSSDGKMVSGGACRRAPGRPRRRTSIWGCGLRRGERGEILWRVSLELNVADVRVIGLGRHCRLLSRSLTSLGERSDTDCTGQVEICTLLKVCSVEMDDAERGRWARDMSASVGY